MATGDLVISHYRVLEPIGSGGMGEVYLGIDETLRRKVALKAIRREYRLQPDTKRRFLREARTLSQLDHPNICRVFDYLETEDRDWLVLELVEGVTLAATIARPRPDHERLRIAQQIAAVLVATHAAGIVHRDLKPGNVMLTHTGQVKVLDFGLSAAATPGHVLSEEEIADAFSTPRMQNAALDETQTIAPSPAIVPQEASVFQSVAGSVKGTVGYMSPEQARGEPATTASDMYSFGLLLQELFTAERPYDPGEFPELLERARLGVSREPRGLTGPITALIKRLKSAAPAQRPTAVDTLERLKWINDAPLRRRRNLIAVALVAAAIAGAVKYTIDLSRERNAALMARDDAQRRRSQAEGLIEFMVGDLRNKLAPVGRLEILDDVGKKALEYFASVPAASLTEEELFRRSQALHQVGQVLQARRDNAGALKAYEESLAQAQEVVRRRPDNGEWQLGLGTSHFYIGDLKMRAGELDDALTHFRAYQQIAEQLVARDPANATYRLEQSYGHSNVAAIYQRQGNLQGAREQLETVLRLQGELAAQKPDDLALRTSRANTFNRLGIVEEAAGDLAAADQSFRGATELQQQLVEANPRDMGLKRRHEVGLIYRGLVLRALGQLDDAMQVLNQALTEAQALATLDATNADWQRDLASANNALSRIDIDQGNAGRALQRLRVSREIMTMLLKKAPTRAIEIRDLASVHIRVAEALRLTHDPTTAAEQLRLAQDLLQRLPNSPSDAETTRWVAAAHDEAAALALARGHAASARQEWQAAADVLRPSIPSTRDRSLLELWARAMVQLGRREEALKVFAQLDAIGYREPGLMALRPS